MVRVGEQYRHYKNQQLYRIIAIALGKIQDKQEEKMVVYQALYDCPDLAKEYTIRPCFVRKYDNFVDDVVWDGKTQKRFQKISERG